MILFGILWAELTLWFLLVIRNKYIVYILPFVMYQVLWNVLPHAVSPIFMIEYNANYNDLLL